MTLQQPVGSQNKKLLSVTVVCYWLSVYQN